MLMYQPWPSESFDWIWIIIVSLVLILAVYYDLKSRIIPNWLSVSGVAALSLYYLILSSNYALEAFMGLGIGLVLFLGAYAARLFGGGDCKLLILVSFAFGAPLLLSVYLWIFISGGVQALLWKFVFKQESLPYAVSIGAGSGMYMLVSLI